MKTFDTYYYVCDGGTVPSHHHPRTVEVHFEKGRFQIWGRSSYPVITTQQQVEEVLKKEYDRVTLTGIKSCFYQEHDRKIKWEQTKY